MRYLAMASRHISSQIRDIQVAFRAAEIRVLLQQDELRNLTTTAKAMNEKVEMLKGSKKEGMEVRIKQMQETQKDLQSRLDRLLTALMKKASPELSEHETKWFEELKRMKQEVLGVGKYDDGSLVAKAKQLEKEYARITPPLKTLMEKERQRKDKLAQSNGSLGFSQAFNLGQRSNIERLKITSLENEITRLADQLAMTLGKAPPLE